MLLKKAEKRFKLETQDYAQLAAFRQALRGFLHFSDLAAAKEGLTSQHYQAMLILRGLTEGQQLSIADLAQQLLIKHNSAVGLVDRLVKEELVLRQRSKEDRRRAELHLSPRGRQVLARLAGMHRRELQRLGPIMRHFFAELAKGQDGDGA